MTTVEYNKQYKLNHKKEISEYNKQYRQKNLDKVKAKQKINKTERRISGDLREKEREYYHANKEKIQAQRHDNYIKNKARDFFSRALIRIRHRAKKRGYETNLTADYLKSIYPKDGLCPVFNHPLESTSEVMNNWSPHLDRIDNTKGYLIGNVQWISGRANYLKKDATLEELKTFCTYYLNLSNDKKVANQCN